MPRQMRLSPDDRRARLHEVIAALRRRYGPHIIRLGADPAPAECTTGPERLSTGSLALDLLVGGLTRGAITEYAGAEGAGTETLALAALAACQRARGLGLLVDPAGAADGEALARAHVDLDALPLACPGTAAEGWEALLALCRCGALDLLLAPLPDLLSLPGTGGARYRPARVLGRLALALRGRATALLLTNRPLAPHLEAEPATWLTAGGDAIARTAALRIALRSAGVRIGPYGDVAALGARARVLRHHGLALGPEVPLEILESGPWRAAELLTLGRATGCLDQTPLGVALAGRVLGRTDARAITMLETDPALAEELERRVRASWAAARAQPAETGAAC